MIIFILKFIHLISLFFAGGGAIGSAVIQSIYKKEGKVPEPHLAKGFRILAFLSLLAVITMWVTGLIMLISIYGSFNLGWTFHMKLLGASLILIPVAYVNFHLQQASKKQIPPNPKVIKYTTSASRIGLILAISGAVGTFI